MIYGLCIWYIIFYRKPWIIYHYPKRRILCHKVPSPRTDGVIEHQKENICNRMNHKILSGNLFSHHVLDHIQPRSEFRPRLKFLFVLSLVTLKSMWYCKVCLKYIDLLRQTQSLCFYLDGKNMEKNTRVHCYKLHLHFDWNTKTDIKN